MSNIRKLGQDIDKATDGGALDSSLEGVSIPPPAKPIGNTSVPAEQYAKATPDSEYIADRSEGFSSQVASANTVMNNDVRVSSNNKVGRPSTKTDLAKLDESMIMDLPFIHAKSFDVAALLQVKPRDPEVRFRWVNWKNNDGSNFQMFKSIGFQVATIEDVDTTVTPLGENIQKEDGLKYFDVILMKVNVIRLMQAYKANIQKSLQMVGRWSQSALKEAQRTFNNDVSPDMINAMRRAGHTVEFYNPSPEEMAKDEKAERQSTSVV